MVQDMACLAVQCCGLLVEKPGEDSEGMGMDRFQLTVRRENCPAPMLPCAPVQSIQRYGRYHLTRGSGEGLEKRSIPGLRGALLPRDWCLISYQSSQWCPVQLLVRQLCRS